MKGLNAVIANDVNVGEQRRLYYVVVCVMFAVGVLFMGRNAEETYAAFLYGALFAFSIVASSVFLCADLAGACA